jgi:hypothetical protein
MYLLLNTRPVMIFDAIGYEELGRQIVTQGWAAYFHQLNREPLFPALVAKAMAAGKAYGLDYTLFLKAFLLMFLAATVVGVYRLVRIMGARRWAAGVAAFYTGVSPSLVNANLWMWSEGAALPWGIWGIFFSIRCWRAARAGQEPRAFKFSLLAGICFIFLFLVKAAVSVVVPVFCLPFAAAGIVYGLRKDPGRAKIFCLSAVILGVVFSLAVESVRWVNWRMNGNYALTNRVDGALFGNTVRRLQPLTRDRWIQAGLSLPRLGLCEQVYGRECVYWTYRQSDDIIDQALKYCARRQLTPEQRQDFLVGGSFRLMARHPFQQAVLSAMESAKMLFWENRVYFVRYPEWLTAVYGNNAWVTGLCFFWAVSSLGGLTAGLFQRRAEVFLPAFFVVLFMAAHAIFFIDIRYALPVAPVLVALSAGMFDSWLRICFSSKGQV